MSDIPKLVAIKVRLRPLVKRKVAALAKSLNISMNQVIAGAIVTYLAERRTKEKP